MKTNPNDQIQSVALRQIGENEFRLATPKEAAVGSYITQSEGLTKREHFAAMAMQGYISAGFKTNGGMSHNDLSKRAVNMADALILALNK